MGGLARKVGSACEEYDDSEGGILIIIIRQLIRRRNMSIKSLQGRRLG